MPAVALAAHAAHQAMFGKQCLMLSAGVLRAPDALLFVKRQFETVQFLLRADGSGQIPPVQCSV